MSVVTLTMEVNSANAKNAYCVFGFPPPSTYTGFAHALTSRAGLKQIGGVVAVVHKYVDRGLKEVSGFNPRFTYALQRSAARDCGKGFSQVDIPKSDMAVSVIFEMTDDDNGDTLDKLDDALIGMRFGGGVISYSKIGLYDTFEKAVNSIGFGYVMCEAELPDSNDPISTMIEKVSITYGKKGWLNSSLVGYRLIEEPVSRDGSRHGHLHAYADPLIGVVEFRSINKERSKVKKHRWFLKRNDNIIMFTTKEKEI